MDFKVTHQKITKLIAELRTWEEDEDRYSGNELAVAFDLEHDVVQTIADSEDIELRWVDPNASTLDLNPEDVKRALNNPDPNPEWVDEDKDTGVWKRDPKTGEFQRIEDEIADD
ncbi:MAG: hypothetical protein E4G90_09750 [Gemmatimonadales bacterium]|nr:MAG: hypothetical protein E4G90_09750 [Gemmatimonadales bacterium]